MLYIYIHVEGLSRSRRADPGCVEKVPHILRKGRAAEIKGQVRRAC